MKPTGRTFYGPTGTLMEMVSERKLYMAISFDREQRSHPALETALEALPFMRAPQIKGIAPLVEHDSKRGLYVYETGGVWPLVDVNRLAKKHGKLPSPRAALEFMRDGATMLEAAYNTGALTNHQGLSPWRAMLSETGELTIIGYGLPQIDVLPDFEGKPDVDSFRYAPPERIEREEEDLTSDILSLGLLGFEFLMGQPLYDGDTEEVRHQASRALGRERLYFYKDRLQWDITEALDRAFARYPDSRHRNTDDFRRAMIEIVDMPANASGEPLSDFMAWVASKDPNGPYKLEEARLAVVPKNEAAPEPRKPRWEAPSRRRKPKPEPAKPKPKLERPRLQRPTSHAARDRNGMYPNRPLSKDTMPMRIEIPNGDTQVIELDREEALAESAARLVDQLLASPIDLTGRIRGWYRIVQGDESWFGDAPTKVLDPDAPIQLEFVPNRVVPIIIRVEADEVEEFEGEVGTTVHTQFLKGELLRELGLSGTNWALFVGEQELNPWQVLDDFDIESLVLTLKRKRRLSRRS